MSTPRVIIYCTPNDLILAARMARVLQADGYQWPADGVAMFNYTLGDNDPGITMAARRNKNGFTIYGQNLA